MHYACNVTYKTHKNRARMTRNQVYPHEPWVCWPSVNSRPDNVWRTCTTGIMSTQSIQAASRCWAAVLWILAESNCSLHTVPAAASLPAVYNLALYRISKPREKDEVVISGLERFLHNALYFYRHGLFTTTEATIRHLCQVCGSVVYFK